MRFKTVGNKVDKAFIVVRNSSTIITIPNGAPCYFTMAAVTTNPNTIGLDVQNAAGAAGGAASAFFAGIVSSEMGPGGIQSGLGPGLYGEAQVWGFVQSLRLVAQTRASSSASFSTSSGSIGDLLAPQTSTIAVTQYLNSSATTAVTLSYDAYSDIGSLPTAFSGSISLTIPASSNASVTSSGVVNFSNVIQMGQYAVLAQTFTVSALASSAINSLGGGGVASVSAGSAILYSTIAVNAFLAYL